MIPRLSAAGAGTDINPWETSMYRTSCSLLCALIALILWAHGSGAGEGGFKPLFNGKNLDGWKLAKKGSDPLDGKTEAHGGRFKVEGGMLIIDPSVKGDLYIETARSFDKDVHIKFDFNPGPGCNNDLFLLGTKFDINSKSLKLKEGDWHTLDIIVKDGNVEHKVDGASGKKTAAKTKSSPFMIRAEFGPIQIKNLVVKE
jgi:hypothetical protein